MEQTVTGMEQTVTGMDGDGTDCDMDGGDGTDCDRDGWIWNRCGWVGMEQAVTGMGGDGTDCDRDERREKRNQQYRIRKLSETEEQLSRRREVVATNQRRRSPKLREVPAPLILHAATGSDVMNDNVQQHFCGNLQLLCTFCGAKHFPGEHPSDKLFTTCCQKGTVTLDPFRI
ncbi:hypothetical protein Btru_078004 [Bulinus truncatus]|nr:hypothetical protein Btru_078004 [Bulinus truncatus]